MAKLTLHILTIVCWIVSLSIAQGRIGENAVGVERQAQMIQDAEESHSIEAGMLDVDEQARELAYQKKTSSYRSGFDLMKAERPRNDREPGALRKKSTWAKKTRKKPYNSSAAAAASKAIRTKKGTTAGEKKRKGGRIKSKFKQLGSSIKNAGKDLKKALKKAEKKAANKRAKKEAKKAAKRASKQKGTGAASSQTVTAPNAEEPEREEPQNPLKTNEEESEEERVEPQNPLTMPKPQSPLVNPQPQSPSKPTHVTKPNDGQEEPVKQTTTPVEPKEPEKPAVVTIPALQDENGNPIQPPLEEDEPKAVTVSNPSPTPTPVIITPAPVMLAVGQSAGGEEEDSPVAAPYYSPAYSPAWSPVESA